MSTQFRVPVLENFSWQPPVIEMDLSSPPVSPTKGDRYVVKATGTGAWSGHDNSIAWFDGSIWKFDAPSAGWVLINNQDTKEYQFNGSIWSLPSDDDSTKADKVSGAVSGDIAALNSSGNLTDSGISTSSVNTAITQAADAFSKEASYDSVLGVLKFNI